jgi:ketosteroid isomerase-like protein
MRNDPRLENAVRAVEAQFYAAFRRLHNDPAALEEFLAIWSHADDVTTMNARGGSERGWEAVKARWEWWVSQGVPMEASRIEHLALLVTGGLACVVVLEHLARRSQRVTHIYRLEAGGWKLVHRHADPLVARHG